MNNSYAVDMMSYLYDEGDRDFILFGEILGMVSYDRDDQPFSKSDERRMFDALKLVDFLVQLGDFCVGHTQRRPDDSFVDNVYGQGFEGFRADASEIFFRDGIDGINLNSGLWLKKVKSGKPCPEIPAAIKGLFA